MKSGRPYLGVSLASAGRLIVSQWHGTGSNCEVVIPMRHIERVTAEAAVTILGRILVDHFGDCRERFSAVGISVGGYVGVEGKMVKFAPGVISNTYDWQDEAVGDALEKMLGIPCWIENDVNCMTQYHHQVGDAVKLRDFMAVYLADDVQGLGCGIVSDGRLIRGSTGGAGEFGHVVIQPDGPRCRCGKRGCLEAMLVVDNFNRDLNWGLRSRGQGYRAGSQLAEEGDERAQHVFRRCGRYLGQGLATSINLLNPGAILLDGPRELVSADYESGPLSARIFMSGVRSAMHESAFSTMGQECEVYASTLNLEIASAGAALLAAVRDR